MKTMREWLQELNQEDCDILISEQSEERLSEHYKSLHAAVACMGYSSDSIRVYYSIVRKLYQFKSKGLKYELYEF